MDNKRIEFKLEHDLVLSNIRYCSKCGREIFNLPDEGILGDEKLCIDCWDNEGNEEVSV